MSVGHSLQLVDLGKSFGAATVLKNVSITADAGSFVSLLGPSGCGKTTTLNIIAGFETPDSGDVLLDGASVMGVPPHRRHFGMVFQSHALFPHMTIAQNVAFPPQMQGISKQETQKRVSRALELVRLEHMSEKYPRQLSGGQQQRIGIARALAAEPRIVLMDEPLSSLDAQLRRDMQSELRRIQRTVGSTVIYVTHDQEEAMALSDQMVLMSSGRIEQAGRPEDLYQRPATSFVASFIGESNLFVAKALPQKGHCSLGEKVNVRVASHDLLTPGAQLTLVVRPERVQLVATAEADDLPVRVVDRNYAGESFRYVLALPDGKEFAAVIPMTHAFLPGPGELAAARVAPADWFIFP